MGESRKKASSLILRYWLFIFNHKRYRAMGRTRQNKRTLEYIPVDVARGVRQLSQGNRQLKGACGAGSRDWG